MPYYDIYSSKPSKIDEFSIYERKLTLEEIEQHNFYCILPPKLYGWDLSKSTPEYQFLRTFIYRDDVVQFIDGTMKSYKSVSSGKHMFEIMVSTPPLMNAPEDIYGNITGFAVGVSDDSANETSVLYNVVGNELPCLENHIMLWISRNNTNGELLLELSYALNGQYNTSPILIDTTMIDLSFEYNTFSVTLDANQKNIVFYCNGIELHAFDYSFIATNLSFKPSYSSANKESLSALINTFGNFEYDIVGFEAWGEGFKESNDDDIIVYKNHSEIITDDNPIIYFPCNERYGRKSFDVINGLVLEHSADDILASYGLADGYCLSYRHNRYFETRRESVLHIPNQLITTSEGAIEFNFTRQAFEISGGFNIFTLKNTSYTSDNWSAVPENGWVMSLNGSIENVSMTNIPEYVMKFDLYYGVKNENINVSYGIGNTGSARLQFDVPLDTDGIYNLIFSFDERKRMWVYINGEIVTRICGAEWCTSTDDFILGMATDLDFGTSYTPNAELLFDNIAIYDKHLTHNDAKARAYSTELAFNEKIDNRLYFLHKEQTYTTTESEMVFLPDKNTYKTVSYNTDNTAWELKYNENDIPIVSVSASRSHIVFLHEDGTVSAIGDNTNSQCNVHGFTNIVKVSAMEDFTVLLTDEGNVLLTDGVSDAWGVSQIPNLSEPVIDIVTGMNHVVILTATGKVRCWGRNDDGQCTIPNDISSIVQIAAGDSSTYGLDTSGYIWAWGSDYFGETSISDIQDSRNVLIDADGYIFASLTSRNNINVCGDIELQNVKQSPLEIITSLSVGKSSIIVGHTHTNYVVDGGLQFSFDEETMLSPFVDEKFAYSLKDENSVYVKSITSGHQYAIAVRSDNKIFGWGRNYYYYGYPLNFPADIQKPIKLVAYYHVLLLEEDGTVKAWGRNNYGQTNVPSSLTDVIDIYLFDYTSVAIRSNGELVQWGQTVSWLPQTINPDFKKIHINQNDQVLLALLNDGTIVEYSSNAATSEFNGLTDIVDFGATEYFSGHNYENFGVALTREGSLLYLNDYDQYMEEDGFVQYPIFNNHMVKITGGEDIGFLDKKGIAYSWDQYDNYIREERSAINLSDNTIDSNNIFSIDASSNMDIWYNVSYVNNPPKITFVPDLTFTADGVSWDFLIDTERGYNNGQTSVDLNLSGNNVLIDWGDGSEPTASSSHIYDIPGIYPIKITGEITYMHYNGWITEVRQWGSGVTFKDMRFCIGAMLLENGSITATDMPRFSGSISFDSAFSNKTFGTLNVSHWDTTLVTIMSNAFGNSNFNEDISRWNVQNVTNLYAAFRDNEVFNQDISTWNVQNVTTLERAFQNTVLFNQDISLWDVSNVINMRYTLYGSVAFLRDLSSWVVSQVTDYYAFSDYSLLDQYPEYLPNFT